eukprot:CAMPEP_0201970738 /NCGR_PEP_ID=MMETSP0904-20121228/33387_1 /ASSEMBLY_ACC=CAM_ASM_000553 /TAXON_ID=420261 /ORGANISM="Thalassiosira antarctica, Strain CCMP982" /LENGTH=320 /DNA_ID=CAMNT_0048519841 /DNA_START=39 /DNA_END=1001 /DNA_ORIENTATION=-
MWKLQQYYQYMLLLVGILIIALTTNDICTCRALSLPPQLQKTVTRGLLVQPPGRPDVFILGTIHVGSESAEEASLLIKTVRPSTVVVEVAPSRLSLIRKRNNENNESNDSSTVQVQTALMSLPALAQKGWTTGGAGGLIFATTILWGSLMKRSLTAREETDTLPRTNEFAAAIAAADAIGSIVMASDMEIEELMGSVAQSMNRAPMEWISLGLNVVRQSIGVQEADPIRRRKDESLVQWAERRRNIATARASRAHGEATAPCISRVLVNERDEIFAESCVKALQLSRGEDDPVEGSVIGNVTVCVVGLVHLDGVVERLKL